MLHSLDDMGHNAALPNFLIGQLGGRGIAFDQAFLDHPADFVMDGLLVGTGGITQFILCLGVVKDIVSCQVVDGEGSHQRLRQSDRQ